MAAMKKLIASSLFKDEVGTVLKAAISKANAQLANSPWETKDLVYEVYVRLNRHANPVCSILLRCD